VRKAFEFNNPLRITSYTDSGATLPSFRISGAPNLVIDTIKRGEDDADVSRSVSARSAGHSVILRIYDALGGKSRGVLEWSGVRVKKVVKVNALEDEGEVLEHGDMEVEIEVRAFEVASYKVVVE
jgi:alpha-mannosidase